MLGLMPFVCPECGSSAPQGGFCTEDGAPRQDASHDPLLGQTLGSYRVACRIGSGGMGQVYKGVHPSIGSRVAIKVLSSECTARPDLVERFFAEARAVNVVRHENIVNVLDLAVLPDQRPYIVMEYLDGESLARALSRPGLSLATIAHWLVEVLSALAAAHGSGIVHRDLKPDNVFITPGGRAKVLDFGIAKLRPDLGSGHGSTRTGSLLGTPLYMSPEQAAGRAADARSDLYSAGVILYQACTGRPPFVAEALYELLRQHIEAPPPLPRQYRPDLPPALEQVILRSLRKDPAHRFQSAAEFAAALAQATQTLSAQGVASYTPTPLSVASAQTAASLATQPITHASSGARYLIPLLGAAALVVVLLGGAAIWIAWRTLRTVPEAPPDPREATVKREYAAPIPSPTAGAPVAVVAGQGAAEPAAFDPHRFDPHAFLPQAQRLAREHLADAQLVRLEYHGVSPGGFIDLTLELDGRACSATYRFRSPAASQRRPGMPLNATVTGACRAYVLVGERGITSYVVDSMSCDEPLLPLPRCSPRQLWTRARTRGAPAGNLIGTLSYYQAGRPKPRWWAKLGSFGSQGGGGWLDDGC